MERIKPRTLSGFMELLPGRQVQFERMAEALRKTYALYGFTPLDTPAIEASEVLLAKGGGETEKQIYRAQNEAVKTEGVTLETYDGKPCLAIKGSYVDELGTPEDVIAYLTQTLYADIQNNADSGSGSGSTNPDWGSATVLSLGDAETPATIFVTAADNEWTVYLDLSARQNTVGEWLFFHYGNSGTNLTSNNIDTDAVITATVGETTVQYRLGVFTGWSSNLVTVYVEAAE